MVNVLNSRTVAYVSTAALVVGAIYILGKKTASVVSDNLDVVTPTSPNNFIYTGVNAIGDILNDGDDNGNFDLGGATYDTVQWFKGWLD